VKKNRSPPCPDRSWKGEGSFNKPTFTKPGGTRPKHWRSKRKKPIKKTRTREKKYFPQLHVKKTVSHAKKPHKKARKTLSTRKNPNDKR